MIAPANEAGIIAAVQAARAAHEPLAIEGQGSKRGMLRPVQAARSLSTRGLTGVTLYRPAELIISARAGTPLAEIETVLAEKGQQLIAESPYFNGVFRTSAPPSLGGVVAANLSGPRRITWGATRDHVMGLCFINGAGEAIRSGGRVLKNVTGLDLCKLLSGSYGTLGVITEVTLKVLPAPETSATLLIETPDLTSAVAALSAGLGSPFGVSAAAALPHKDHVMAALRLEDFAASVSYRIEKLRGTLDGFGAHRVMKDGESHAFWRGVREVEPLQAAAEDAIWRVSVRPSAGPPVAAVALALGGRVMLDWGGGLVWIAASPSIANHAAISGAARSQGGAAMLFRAPEALRLAVPVLPEEAAPLARIGARVKEALDPGGLFNPGHLRAA
ncbi:MAG: glycolate oxidase subunit GlcE [Roseomonas sp.]|nr:glycolate oxidase subunit GlcE [Roseomonas sp.]MCA3327834.1 glycolate oxidase subunit GlcE [Roseomonas sp.]MCA3329618.1 glycolate oxidase subunit GlcE [Roseomonas sp.]MCA3334525.1 glycolate oxidase subunit GlcE [Roseomonas sp.]MCA3347838.1 glycolate oxidase subunit GlcE [Roseomonas sp.]